LPNSRDIVGSVYRMSQTLARRKKRVPAVGEHQLGIDAQEMRNLQEEPAI
jgi:hypothetical protein